MRFFFTVLAAVATGTTLQAQTPDSLLASGDTLGAIAAYEDLLRRDGDDAEAHYRVGVLYRLRIDPDAAVSADRRRAEEHLRLATRIQPDSAKYWLELAAHFRASGNAATRAQVPGMLDRARDAALAYAPDQVAEAEYWAGVTDWERYEQLAHRYLFRGEVVAVDQAVLMGDWDDLEDFFARQVIPDPGNPGAGDRRAAEDHLRGALAANPRHVPAAGLLVVLMGEEDRWAEAYEVARTLVRAAPDSGRAWALAGLALTREGRWAAAQAAFDTAMQRMSPAERAPYQNLGVILKSVDQVRFEEMSDAERARLEMLYWAVTQPLFLSNVNEPRVEFMARLTYVDHRWSDAGRRFRGFESDRGAVYLRYGPPDIWASFGRGRGQQMDPMTGGGDPLASLEGERNLIAWVYEGSELRFMFALTPGFTRASFAGDFRSFYREAHNVFPVRFDNVPAVAEMDTILVQFVQFRGEGALSTELGIFTFMPIGRMARGTEARSLQLTTAAMLRDGLMRDVQRDVRNDTIPGGDPEQVERRSFRFEVQPASYLLRVEAMVAEAARAARSTSLLNVRPYGTDSLLVSDLLLAERVAPHDSSYRRWRDFFIIPSAGRLGSESPVALLWEVYNLQPDSTGTARYTVDLRITVREVERRGLVARILGGIGDAVGLSAQGDDEVSLSYEREVTVAPADLQVEYLTVDLEDAPRGLYGVFITITDRATGQSVTARRQFMVTDTPLTAR